MQHELESSLVHMVEEQVKRTPDIVAVVYSSDECQCDVKITYTEMWRRANQVHRELDKCQVKDSVIGISIRPSINMPSVLLGIMLASCSYFPFDSDGVGFIKQALRRLNVNFLLLDCHSFQKLNTLLLEYRSVGLPSSDLQEFGLYLVCLDVVCASQRGHFIGLAYCITTSGTTGTPKIVRVPHSCIIPNVFDFRSIFQISVGDVIILTSPLTFDPSVVEIFTTLSGGATLLVISESLKLVPKCFIAICQKHGVSVLQITPTLIRNFGTKLLSSSLLAADSLVRVLSVGGELFPCETLFQECVHADNSTVIYNVYGATELSCWASIYCVRQPKGKFSNKVPIGLNLSGTKIKVLDEGGNVITTGEGHLWIGGDSRKCLVNDENQQLLEGGEVWRNTGDLARVDDEGNIFCLGRLDRQIKRFGKRLDLDTLEKVAAEVGDVAESQSVFTDSTLYLFVKAKRLDGDVGVKLSSDVKRHLAITLPSQYLPDHVTLIHTFPVNRHGKLDVDYLLSVSTKGMFLKNAADVELWLADLWQEHTGRKCEHIPHCDMFISSGGNSLKAVHMASAIEDHFCCAIPDLLETIVSRSWCDVLELVTNFFTPIIEGGCVSAPSDNPSLMVKPGHSKIEQSGKNYSNCSRERGTNDLSETVSLPKKQKFLANENDHLKHRYGRKLTMCVNQISPNDFSFRNQMCLLTDKVEHSSSLAHIKCSAANYVMGASDSCCFSCEFQTLPESDRQCHQRDACCHVSRLSSADHFIVSIGKGSSFSKTESGSCGGDCLNNCPLSRKTCQGIDRVCLSKCWSFDTGKCVDASPLVAVSRSGKGVVFIGSHSHQFFAVDIVRGVALWTTSLPDRVEGSACLSSCGQSLFVGCYDGGIYMLDAWTGHVTWKVMTGDVVKCTPVAHHTKMIVFCGSHDGFLYALESEKHIVAWKHWLGGGGIVASPVTSTDGKTVFAANLRGHVLSISITGVQIWWLFLGAAVFSSLALDDTNLYVCTVGCKFYCLSAHNGQTIWTYKTMAPIFSSPVISKLHGLIFFGSHDGHLYCVDKGGGLRWKMECGIVYSTPFVFTLCSGISGKKENCCHTGEPADISAVTGRCLRPHNAPGSDVGLTIDLQDDDGIKSLTDDDPFHVGPHTGDYLSDTGDLTVAVSIPSQVEDEKCLHTGARPSTIADMTSHVVCDDANSLTFGYHNTMVVGVSTMGELRIHCCLTGTTICAQQLPGEVFSSPVVAGNRLIVGCRDNNVYCYELSAG